MTGGRGSRTQVLVALCAAGVALFNFPLLIVWDQPATVLGLPLLPVALFAIWAGLIAALAFVNERGGGHDDTGAGGETGPDPRLGTGALARPESGSEFRGPASRGPEPRPGTATRPGDGAP